MTNTTNYNNLYELFNTSNNLDIISMLGQNPQILPTPQTGYLLLWNNVMHPNVKTLFKTCIDHFDVVKKNIDFALNTLFDSDIELLRSIYGLNDGVRVAFPNVTPQISESEIENYITAIRRLRHPKRRHYFAQITA